MKMMTKEQEDSVKEVEKCGDSLLEKDTFESCLSAFDQYATAQTMLHEMANDQKMDNAKPYPAFNSENVSYKAWYASLASKMAKANAAMANPRMRRK